MGQSSASTGAALEVETMPKDGITSQSISFGIDPHLRCIHYVFCPPYFATIILSTIYLGGSISGFIA